MKGWRPSAWLKLETGSGSFKRAWRDAPFGESSDRMNCMDTGSSTHAASHPAQPIEVAAPVARGIGARLLHEAREALPPTLFVFVRFNFVVFTTNLLLADHSAGSWTRIRSPNSATRQARRMGSW